MKNKKLFAILTLVCFMFTLMPVAAFAATPAITVDSVTTFEKAATANEPYRAGFSVNLSGAAAVAGDYEMELYSDDILLTTISIEDVAGIMSCAFYTIGYGDSWTQTKWLASSNLEPDNVVLYIDGVKVMEADIEVPDDVLGVATADPISGNIDAATSTFVAEDGNQSAKVNEEVVFELDVEDKAYGPAAGQVFIWAEENGKASSALTVTVPTDANADSGIRNVWVVDAADYDTVKVAFNRAGEYTVYAALAEDTDEADFNEVRELTKFESEFSVIKVKSASVDPEESYEAVINGSDPIAADGTYKLVAEVVSNNVFANKVDVYFTVDGEPLKNKTIAIETNSASIEVNKASDKTNSQGHIDFKVAGSVEGEYEVILSVDGVEWTIEVEVGNTAATYIETVKEPVAPVALWADFEDEEVVAFAVTDINGNAVTSDNKKAVNGMAGIFTNKTGGTVDGRVYGEGSFVVLTEAPEASDLESDDLTLKYDAADQVWYLDGVNTLDAEGTYAVKVILDNGATATAEWTVKKFQTPVRLMLGYATTTIELGSATTAKMFYIDANGVQKLAKDAEFAATGYAVAKAGISNLTNFPEDEITVPGVGKVDTTKGAGYGKVVAKSDEKYVGAKINVTAISEKYDLVGTAVLTVAEGASAIVVADASADVNVNNKITWNVVDEAGNKVTLTNGVSATDISYVVLDKPEGAKVSVNDATNTQDLNSKGEGKLALTSNKVGNVTVQVVLKAYYNATAGDDNMQVKYYTGTAVIPVGTDSTGDVVVMSIGSNQIVKNDEVATMIAAPIVKDARTFVPFRALAEAFGAEVAWDEATQAVTAELNGVKVVLTIGSADYTVNGVVNTADVAPFINGASTMVPVRFVAEAFGIKVIPTYDANGATADILFNL